MQIIPLVFVVQFCIAITNGVTIIFAPRQTFATGSSPTIVLIHNSGHFGPPLPFWAPGPPRHCRGCRCLVTSLAISRACTYAPFPAPTVRPSQCVLLTRTAALQKTIRSCSITLLLSTRRRTTHSINQLSTFSTPRPQFQHASSETILCFPHRGIRQRCDPPVRLSVPCP